MLKSIFHKLIVSGLGTALVPTTFACAEDPEDTASEAGEEDGDSSSDPSEGSDPDDGDGDNDDDDNDNAESADSDDDDDDAESSGSGDDDDDDASTGDDDDDDTSTGDDDDDDDDDMGGIPVLGDGTHSMNNVVETLIADSTLNNPTDVELHPERTTEIWVTNHGDDSVSIIKDILSGSPQPKNYKAGNARHFLANPSGLAMSDTGMMATSHDEDMETQGPNAGKVKSTFMGPTLWHAGEGKFDGGHSTHYDMLHRSTNAGGIAWEKDNIYWVHNGADKCLDRYNFNKDHGPGNTDHTDGEMLRYARGGVSYTESVVSHLVYVPGSKMLYIADGANSRISLLDTTSGTVGNALTGNEKNLDGPAANYKEVDGAKIETLIDGKLDDINMPLPAGLEIHDDIIFVSDNETSVIFGFSMEGELLDYLETGLPSGSIMGMTFDEEGNLYFANFKENEVVRISPKDGG